MDLLYFFKVLYRKRWIIAILTVLAVAVAFVVLLYKKPLYESGVQYSTGFTAQKVTLLDGTSAVDLYVVDVKFNNVIETIKSPQVIGMVSYKLLLHDLMYPADAYRKLTIKNTESQVYKDVNIDNAKRILNSKILNNELLSSDVEEQRQIIEYLKLYKYDYDELLKYLTVERVESTDYLDISFLSENPELSALVVNQVGDQFLNYYKNLNSQRTQENATNIREMVDSQQNEVDSLGQSLLKEKISQGTIDPESKTASAMETVQQLEVKLADEKSKYNDHQNKLASLNQELTNLQSGMSQSSSSNDEVLQLTNKKNALVEQLSREGGNDPSLQQQINDLRSQIILKSNSGSNKSKISDNIDDLKRQIIDEQGALNASSLTIEDYNAKIHEYLGMTNIDPGGNVKLEEIKRKLDIANNQLKNTKDKYSQAEGLSKDDPTANFIQTRIGEPAIEPESKKTMIKMGLSGISMIFLSSIFFIFLEVFDSSVKTPSIFSKYAKTGLVSVLNKIKLKHANVMDIIMEEQDSEESPDYSIFKNNIRKLRYELLNSGKSIFLVTSTQRSVGKSTVIEALSTALLLSKKKVLIMDLNFSHNSLTQKFNTEVYIQDIASRVYNSLPVESQKLWDNTLHDNLFITGCKQANNTPAEILYNIDMPGFLQILKKHFDIILIEGASLQDHADSKELAQYAEAVFTIFTADASLSPADMESLQFIKALKEKNYGIILNEVLPENINS